MTTEILVEKTAEDVASRSLKVTVPVERVRAAEDKALKYYARKARLPGFRQGKAPEAVVRRRFGVTYTLAGLDLLLHRIGWSVQVPARQAAERDEAAIAAWKEETWPVVKGRRRTWAPGWSSRTSPARA